jgi:AraC-like DNA-binding protein
MQSPSSGAAVQHGILEASDPLVAMITLLRPQAVLSKVVSGSGDWSIRYERSQDPAFCLMLEGRCFLEVDGIGLLELRQGDFVFLPEMPGFVLASDPSLTPTPVTPAHVAEVRHGRATGPAGMRMLGGWFHVDPANARLLVRLLPPAVHIRREEEGAARVGRIVELIADETRDKRPGQELILERLVQVLLVEALRFLPTSPGRQERGLLAGLSDPALASILRAIHVDVARRWTVADLARSAFMSRAAFAERFARKVGMPPMEYVLEWRMAIAKDLLRNERPPLARVAERVGYQSASAFSTAFTRFAGCPPSEFARLAE